MIKTDIRTRLLLLSVVSAAIISVTGCSGRSVGLEDNDNIGVLSSGVESGLTPPSVPDSISFPEERADYAAVHFWDDLYSMNNSSLMDTAFMEQSFSNFTVVLKYASDESREKAVSSLINRCKENNEVLRLLTWITYKYLDDPNSPMRSEELFVPFLQSLANGGDSIPEEIRVRAEGRLEDARLNQPGSKTADFLIITRTNIKSTLHKAVRNDTTIVMFYDSGCSHCKETVARVSYIGESLPYKILAIDVAGNRDLWESEKNALPQNWEVAFAIEDPQDKDLYVFPALPSFYLLTPDATVILKDFPLIK